MQHNFFATTLFLLFALALVLPTAVDALPAIDRRGTFSGTGTFYTVGLGSCGEENSDSDMVVALSSSHITSGTCGQKIKATTDRGSVICTVVDTCPACGENDIDFSPGAFRKIADFASGRVPISWSFV